MNADRRRELPLIRAEGLGPEPPAGHVRVAFAQTEPRIGEAEANVDACLRVMEQAKAAGARLVVFTECVLTGYCFEDPEEAWDAALEADGPELARLARGARDLDLFVAAGYLKRLEEGIANTASVWGPSGLVADYHKTHLPFLGVDKFVTPGCEPYTVHEVAGLRLGLLICWDASFPEATRVLALEGADLVLLPTNWPREADIKAGWLPNARAYENVIYFAAVNRVGEERGFEFRGRSRLCAPDGATVIEGPRDTEAILVADLDPEAARTKRIERRGGEYWVDRIGRRREDLYVLAARDPASADEEDDS